MQCPHCAASITHECRICPKCGLATVDNAVAPGADGFFPLPTEADVRTLPSADFTTAVPAASQSRDASQKPQAENNATSLLTRANLHRLRNEWKEATDCCVAVLRLQSGNQTAHSLLGDIYRDQGRLDDAIQWYRMAIELRPNPSDEAKLARTERERNQLMNEDAQRQRAGYGPTPERTATDEELNAGTVNLMGVSPHRWLRGLWVTSLSFLIIMLIALMNINATRRPAHASTKPSGTGGFAGGNGALPPGRPQIGAPVIRQDLFTGSQTDGTPRARGSEPSPILSTAPVTVPANGLVNAPRDSSAPPAQSAQLTDGLTIQRTQNVGNGGIAVLILAPQAFAEDATHEVMIRNLYRAARTALAESETYTHATVFVQIPAAGDAGAVAIMEGAVSRDNATSAKPDTDSVESLTSHLTGFKWAGPSAPAPQNPAPQNPAAPNPTPPNPDTGAAPPPDTTPPGN